MKLSLHLCLDGVIQFSDGLEVGFIVIHVVVSDFRLFYAQEGFDCIHGEWTESDDQWIV